MKWKKKAIYVGYCPVGIETSKAKFRYDMKKTINISWYKSLDINICWG
jgi:hypothetical protein